MPEAWTIRTATEGPADSDPIAWLKSVLPRIREPYQGNYGRARKALREGDFDPQTTVFAVDDRGPVGITVVQGEVDHLQVLLVGVRGDRRRRGLGAALLKQVIGCARGQDAKRITVPGVSSANVAAVGLLEHLDFDCRKGGGIRMRRSLEGRLPEGEATSGYSVRALEPGEEAAWVKLFNECFHPEEAEWTPEDFGRQYQEMSCFDWGRVFIALDAESMVGTATAWEHDFGDGPAGLVHWVGVKPEARGQGLGTALSVRVLEELAARGYADAWLNTSRERQAAVKLYQRLGFEVHAETCVYTYEG